MTAMDVREPVNATAIHRVGGLAHRCHDSSLEEAAIDALARMLCRATTPTGPGAQELLARLSDDDLSALYLSCALRICGMRGPISDAHCHNSVRCAVSVVTDNIQRGSCARF
ncbi:hypothetical protein ACFZBP_05000 [Streptomyces sp. NPDC008086]|uniref:hypothetical protein n=1 Tax=Streptomyces sp. NPDC008086 TaxID=3364807 RepID=UPI0036F0D8C8